MRTHRTGHTRPPDSPPLTEPGRGVGQLRGRELLLTSAQNTCKAFPSMHMLISSRARPPLCTWFLGHSFPIIPLHLARNALSSYSSLVAQLVKNLPERRRLGLGRSLGEGNGNPLQHSDGGAWRATIHGVARGRHNLVTKPLP